MRKRTLCALALIFALLLALSACAAPAEAVPQTPAQTASSAASGEITLDDLPDYSGEPYVTLCGGEPEFSDDELTTDAFETYSQLDELGRCGVAYANICRELMPTEKRGSIGQIRPSGWQTAKYDFVDGQYLYNRCHLIGFQLAGENANERNLITGTRYLNVEGMLPFENMVADYVKETDGHVLYRVRPVFDGDDLVAQGVTIEARSVEDGGEGICFYVYCYNVQPGVAIDYATGASRLDETAFGEDEQAYVLNTGTRRFHLPSCGSVADMKQENRQDVTAPRELLIAQGYEPCGRCKP